MPLEPSIIPQRPKFKIFVRELAGLKDPMLVPRHCMRKMFVTRYFQKPNADPEAIGHLVADDPNTLRKHYLHHGHKRLLSIVNG